MTLILQLLIIYYSGQAFSHVAKDYNRSVFLYGLVGAGICVFVQQVGLFLLTEFAPNSSLAFLRNISKSFYGLISIGVSVVVTYFLYEYLEWHWKHPKEVINDDILDE